MLIQLDTSVIQQHLDFRDFEMNTIALKQDGSILLNGKTVATELLKVLGFRVELEEGFPLRGYFEMLGKYSLLLELNDFFPVFREQFRDCPKNGCCFNSIEYLEFSKTIEMIGFPGKRLEIYTSLMGIYGQETCEIKSLQLENLLDLPVKLGRLKHVIFGDRVDIFEFDTVYTLFEFIDGIAWELSFHGTPKQCEIRR
jgi:hypothetical protein